MHGYASCDDDRPAFVGLSHQERCCRSDLIGERYFSTLQLAAIKIWLPAAVCQRGQAARADRNSHNAVAKCPAMAITDEDSDLDAGQFPEFLSQLGASPVRILRQQQCCVVDGVVLDIREVDPGIGHDEAKAVRDNQHIAALAYDFRRTRAG